MPSTTTKKNSPASGAKKTAADPITGNSYEEFAASIKAQLKDEAEYDDLVAKIKAELLAEQKPATVQPGRLSNEAADMSRTHELVLDAVTAMLTTGGHPEDVDRLLRSTMAHTRRRTYSGFGSVGDAADKGNKEFVQNHINEWKIDLAVFWSKNRRAERPEDAKETFTQIIRANTREKVWGLFEEFMANGSVDEQVLMLNVLSNRDHRNFPAEHKQDEIYLATAFAEEIDRCTAYMKVPKSMVEQTQAYVNALRAIERKEV
jgi:hypothetical protein